MMFKKACFIVLCAVLVCMCLVSCDLTEMFGQESKETTALIEIPNIASVSKASAENILSSSGLIPVVKYEHSASIEKGCVIRTEPEFGLSLEKNSVVTLYVSNGNQLRVPNLQNIDEASAQNILSLKGLIPAVKYEISEDIVQGNIIRSEPEFDSMIEEGAIVTLYVSNGPTPKVPDVIKMDEETATKILVESKYIPVVSYKYNDSIEKGCIISTSPREGVETKQYSQVLVVVSKGRSYNNTTAKKSEISLSRSNSALQSISLDGNPYIQGDKLYIKIKDCQYNKESSWTGGVIASPEIICRVSPLGNSGSIGVRITSSVSKKTWAAYEKQSFTLTIPLSSLGGERPDTVYIRLFNSTGTAYLTLSMIW